MCVRLLRWDLRWGIIAANVRLGRLTLGQERICFLQLRLDGSAMGRLRRRNLRTQLHPLLFEVPASMDFGRVQTSTHDCAPQRDENSDWCVTAFAEARIRQQVQESSVATVLHTAGDSDHSC
jgi:hypothetical protein